MGNEKDNRVSGEGPTGGDTAPAALRALAEVTLSPGPHFETRVLAAWRERRAAKRVPRFWKSLALGTSALSFATIAFLVFSLVGHAKYEAFVGRPFVVKMEVSDLKLAGVAKARIRLPDGVHFDLEDFPQLRDQRELTLAWTNRDAKEFVPLVLSASEEGTKRITVVFLDDAGRTVGEKAIDVRLRRGTGNG